MPEIIFKTYSNSVSLLVWHITETTETLLKMLPTTIKADQTYLSIAVPHLKKEFLVGRILVQEMCHKLGIDYIGVTKDEHGKPHITDSRWEMSVTHCKDYVAVVVHPSMEVGVDIEKPNAKMKRIMPRLFSEAENDMVGNDLVKMSWFWSAKEALYKLYGKRGIDFKEHLHLQLTDDSFTGHIQLPNRHSAHTFITEKIGSYYLIIAI